MDAMNLGTYTLFERVPGQIYGEGQGMVQMSDGEGSIWNGHGISVMTGDGMASKDRYSVAVQAASLGKLARLNSVLILGENEVDAEGNITMTLWEWK